MQVKKKYSKKYIDRFEFFLHKIIGRGSFSIVYTGKDTESNKLVAIKVVNKQLLYSKVAINNVLRYTSIIPHLKHPNILSTHQIIQSKTNLYIITQLCQCNLFSKIHQKLPFQTMRKYLCQIIAGIQYLYFNNIFHRDLKLENIFLKNNIAMIGDFGFARKFILGEKINQIVGSPLYMAPEILSKKSYDIKSDIWSLGCLIYQLFLKQPPFISKNEKMLLEKIYSTKLITSTLPFHLQNLINSCLIINPQQRLNYYELFDHPFIKGYYIPRQLNVNAGNRFLSKLKNEENMQSSTTSEQKDSKKSFISYQNKKNDSIENQFRSRSLAKRQILRQQLSSLRLLNQKDIFLNPS